MALFSLNASKPEFVDPHGKPFFCVGVNYEGYFDRAWAMWRNDLYDPQLIETDFAKARVCGFNTVRLFVQAENTDEIKRGQWKRFDTVFNLARQYGLAVMLTFNDEHSPNLAGVGQLNAKIAAHFKGDPIIHSWDLENEPRLFNLLVANYPGGVTCPLLTSALIDHYGEFVPRSRLDLSQIPAALRNDSTKAYYYRNAVEAYVRFNQDAIASGLPSTVDYLLSAKAQAWKPFLGLLNDTIAAWIGPQLAPLKETDPTRLCTIGWNWEILAALPATKALDFHQIHKYGSVGYKNINKTFSMLKALQKAHPNQPILMGEFGYSTDQSTDPARPEPVDARLAALHEAAMLCFLRAEGFSGGMKWMLNDVRNAPNPFEAGLGVYADQEQEKPSRRVYSHLSALWRQTDDRGRLQVTPDDQTHVRLHYQCDRGGLTAGGGSEEVIIWQTGRPAHIFTTCSISGQIRVEADAALAVQVNPITLSPLWPGHQGAAVYRLKENTFSPESAHPAGKPVPISLTDQDAHLLTPL